MKLGGIRLNFSKILAQNNSIFPKYKNSPMCGVTSLLFISNYCKALVLLIGIFGMQRAIYLGQTGSTFKIRYNEHIHDIKRN
jgi:hypothetical protein